MTGDPLAVFCAENVPHAVPEQLAPAALQFTAPPSLAFPVSDNVCVIVNPARIGEMETETALAIVRESVAEFVWAGWLESVTLKVSKTAFTVAVVGVPLIAPLVERLRPAGSVPAVVTRCRGAFPRSQPDSICRPPPHCRSARRSS